MYATAEAPEDAVSGYICDIVWCRPRSVYALDQCVYIPNLRVSPAHMYSTFIVSVMCILECLSFLPSFEYTIMPWFHSLFSCLSPCLNTAAGCWWPSCACSVWLPSWYVFVAVFFLGNVSINSVCGKGENVWSLLKRSSSSGQFWRPMHEW